MRLSGRERELGVLASALERAREGEGGVVAVSGEPGIGKTMLARALAATAMEQGVPLLWAVGSRPEPRRAVIRRRVERLSPSTRNVLRAAAVAGWEFSVAVVAAMVHAPAIACLDALDEARGMTNRQIAETLVLSERTAENHVQHILTKLGMDSRIQIAAWVATRQASEPE
jgi:predicted ATPase